MSEPIEQPEAEPASPGIAEPTSTPAWMLLILPLALLIGCLWQIQLRPVAPGQGPLDAPAGLHNRNPQMRRLPPLRAPAPMRHAATAGSGTSTGATVFLPGEGDELLHAHAVPGRSGLQQGAGVHSSAALDVLFKTSPSLFPSGTRLLEPVREKDGVLQVNLSKEFEQPDHWQGSTQTEVAVYSIVNTVADAHKSSTRPPRIQLLSEGKPLQTVGEMDVHDPLEPRWNLVSAH